MCLLKKKNPTFEYRRKNEADYNLKKISKDKMF